MNRQIFGRQPVVWVAAIQTLLMLLVSFHKLSNLGLNGPDDVMLVSGVLNAAGALYLVFGTTEATLAALVELFKAGASLAAIYGLHLTGEQAGLAVLTINALFAFVVHQPATSPQVSMSFKPGPVLLAPANASPTYDAQDAGGVVSKGERGNVTVAHVLTVAILASLAIAALALFLSAALLT